VDAKEGKVKASVEEIATYNMLLTEAIYELLADKGDSFKRRSGRAHSEAQRRNNHKFSSGSVEFYSRAFAFKGPRSSTAERSGSITKEN